MCDKFPLEIKFTRGMAKQLIQNKVPATIAHWIYVEIHIRGKMNEQTQSASRQFEKLRLRWRVCRTDKGSGSDFILSEF